MDKAHHNNVEDLLINIHQTRRTFTNYASVFGIKLADYFIGQPERFSERRQVIHKELYQYFERNKSFVEEFYKDWHKPRTMVELADMVQQDISDVLDLFKSGRIFMNRLTNGVSFNEKTLFNYYSSYQIAELLTGKQVIERPGPLWHKIHISDKFDKIISLVVKELPNPIRSELESVSWEIDLNEQESPYSLACQISLTFKKVEYSWSLLKYTSTLLY